MRQATWYGLELALEQGLTRAIGVSNFKKTHLQEILRRSDGVAATKPAVNQCSMHIGGHDDETIAFCKEQRITYEAYSPLGGADLGGVSVLAYPEVKSMARTYGVPAASIALRWLVQAGHPVVSTQSTVPLVDCKGCP